MARRVYWRRRPIFPLIVAPPEDRLAGEEPKRAKGKAIERTDEEIAAMSRISPGDQRTAREDWIDHTTPRYRGLVDATEEPQDDDGTDEPK